ncbi:type IV secretion system protein [uncultured Kingella sp.]|uniref:type IV secretion system protein n=1 Tax=uncultured Kingella sp. TaxID=159270 RepID=UPI00259A675A|nr:type IV secretion system protein [uncultured Kingella sp.]
MVSSVFQDLTDTFVVKFGTELFNNVGTFISNISPLFASGFCLYIVIIALDAYNRGLDENVVDLSKRMMGWLIIIAFAFNASQYNSLAQIIYNMPETLSQAFGKSVDIKMFDSAALAMDVIGAQLNLARMDLDITDAGNILALWAIEGWLRFCTNVLLSVVFAYWVIAKIVLALNLMVGPMFIGSMLFPGTRQYGMNWIGQCLNSILTIGLLSVLAGIEIQTFKEHIDNAKMAITQA